MKIGFIAMSGVRVHSPELVELGLNLPGFVERSEVIASLPSLGLLTLAGMTPRHIDVDYVEVADLDALDGLPGDFDVVAISSFTAMIKDAYQLADRFRAEGVTVILGGLHVTMLPDEAEAHADCIVIGEAEPVWAHVIRDLEAGELRVRPDTIAQSFSKPLSATERIADLDLAAVPYQTQLSAKRAQELPSPNIENFQDCDPPIRKQNH